jgi:hypothetical protein
MSGCERASQLLGSYMRRCMAVGMPCHGVPIWSGSRKGRAALGIGLLVALRVVGKGWGERGGTEHERSGGGEDYGSVAKHGEFSFALVKRGDHGM